MVLSNTNNFSINQSARAIEYTDAPLQRSKTPTPDDCPVYDTKQSHDELPVMLGLWEMQNTP